jgi:hypothetical protein
MCQSLFGTVLKNRSFSSEKEFLLLLNPLSNEECGWSVNTSNLSTLGEFGSWRADHRKTIQHNYMQLHVPPKGLRYIYEGINPATCSGCLTSHLQVVYRKIKG